MESNIKVSKESYVEELLNSNSKLKGLEDLVKKAIEDTSSIKDEIKKSAKGKYKLLKKITDSGAGDLANILEARKFTFPNAFYGHRHQSNMMVEWNIRPPITDLYCTDSSGFLKNNINDDCTSKRVKYALERKIPIICFFGGSTMMSMGMQTPDFSIPALVENILKKKFGKETVCINYALAGSSSREAVNLYLHDARMLSKSANVVFYDGWNCASSLTKLARINLSKKLINKNLLSTGLSMRHIEHNFVLSKIYDLSWHLSYIFKLSFAQCVRLLSIIPFKKPFRALILLQDWIMPLTLSKTIATKLANLNDSDLSIKESSKVAVDQYIDIHKSVFSICNASNSEFLWIQQPLLFWGKKPLTENEKKWKTSGYSSGDPRTFYEFEKNFSEQFKSNSNDKIKESFFDFSGVFDNIKQEMYIDSGHINRLGNLVVSASIADLISKRNGFFK